MIQQINKRMVELALKNKAVQGRKKRVDTTVVETNIHYPTASGLLDDRVLTRLMKKVTAIAGAVGTKLRNRMRSVQRRVAAIARASRAKGGKGLEKARALYGKLLDLAGRVPGQAKRFSAEFFPMPGGHINARGRPGHTQGCAKTFPKGIVLLHILHAAGDPG